MNKKLNKKQFSYIKNFVESRRVKRDVNILVDLYKGENGYPGRDLQNNTIEEVYGIEGSYFSSDICDNKAITNDNMPPGETEIIWTSRNEYIDSSKKLQEKRDNSECQPGLWCNWEVIEHDNNHILQWNDGEKFYEYINWLKYLIVHFFNPWEILLNGEITWSGEDILDYGKIVVVDNLIEIYKGHGG